MHPLRLQLRSLTWLALVAILALALLPTLSRAMAYVQGGSNWAEICTPQGAKRVALAEDGSAATPDKSGSDSNGTLGAMHLQHCPLCSLAFDAPALPPAAVTVVLSLASAAPPALYLHAPYTLHAWRSAQPRGPPPIS